MSTAVAPEETLLTVADAARVLRFHPSTIRRLIYRGDLGAITVGRQTRIRRAELERFIGAQPDARPSSEA